MKPLYWKFLLIIGAMIVGASLVVPKALRKNAAQSIDKTSQTLFLTPLDQNNVFETVSTSPQNEIDIDLTDRLKPLTTLKNVSKISLGFKSILRFLVNRETPTYTLNAGTRPTKSRVID